LVKEITIPNSIASAIGETEIASFMDSQTNKDIPFLFSFFPFFLFFSIVFSVFQIKKKQSIGQRKYLRKQFGFLGRNVEWIVSKRSGQIVQRCSIQRTDSLSQRSSQNTRKSECQSRKRLCKWYISIGCKSDRYFSLFSHNYSDRRFNGGLICFVWRFWFLMCFCVCQF